MINTKWRRAVVTGIAVAASLLMATASAQAVTEDGAASLGAVNVVYNYTGQHVATGPLASCDVNGQNTAYSPGTVVPGIARYGIGNTRCSRDFGARTAQVDSTGSRFQLDALVDYGGPRIRIERYQATCHATERGTEESIWLSGLTGVTVPSTIPANYTVTIPSRFAGAPPLARVIFNEVMLPEPGDGSIGVNLMRVILFPNGGPQTGDVVVGSAACSPVF
ncbi:choice-of-anchor P family protein [Gandjariella thermophila]|uniref:Uncharacterized protein n=1 Tax=Gandjariella thermophila TaxID=1931992 RepID=A0A4D4JHE2_9PSEU|nr:choice-of-anchor P family protein [Gandjariella thermophila]GDY33323.1 hypothetical protein GTS_49560 [Gandjariella thermophila]